MTSTTFSQSELCKNEFFESSRQQSLSDQLEEACWNGLLDELLPEIMERPASGKKLLLWHIRQGEFFLQIELSESSSKVETEFSIDVNSFLPTLSYS